eukprot:15367159-Ditylum_brightwellii.AAC.1
MGGRVEEHTPNTHRLTFSIDVVHHQNVQVQEPIEEPAQNRASSSSDERDNNNNKRNTIKTNENVDLSLLPLLCLSMVISNGLVCGECFSSNENQIKQELKCKIPKKYHNCISDVLVSAKERNVKVAFDHIGDVLSLRVCCGKDHSLSYLAKTRKVEKKKGSDNKNYGRKKLSNYNVNVKMLLASYTMGVGGEEIQQMLTLLDLPEGGNYGAKGLSRVEEDVGYVLKQASNKCMS